MRLSRKVEIQITPKLEKSLLQHVGNARWAYNWGLVKHQEAYAQWVELGKPKKWKGWPSGYSLHKELNLLKKKPVEEGGVPWMYEAGKAAPQEALMDLEAAFKNFFAGRAKYPKFRKKSHNAGSFRVNSTVRATDKTLKLPTIGVVRLQPGEYGYIPQGIYSHATISQKNGRWFVSVVLPDQPDGESNGKKTTAIDLRVASALVTLADGSKVDRPKALDKNIRKIKRLQREVARKVKGSANRLKAIRRLSKVHARVAHIREDALHKITTELTKNHGCLVIEDLSIQKMAQSKDNPRSKQRRVNRGLLDSAFFEFRRLLEYKGKLNGCAVVAVNPAYTTQKCTSCGYVDEKNRVSNTEFVCQSCGFQLDLAHNAAINILAAAK